MSLETRLNSYISPAAEGAVRTFDTGNTPSVDKPDPITGIVGGVMLTHEPNGIAILISRMIDSPPNGTPLEKGQAVGLL